MASLITTPPQTRRSKTTVGLWTVAALAAAGFVWKWWSTSSPSSADDGNRLRRGNTGLSQSSSSPTTISKSASTTRPTALNISATTSIAILCNIAPPLSLVSSLPRTNKIYFIHPSSSPAPPDQINSNDNVHFIPFSRAASPLHILRAINPNLILYLFSSELGSATAQDDSTTQWRIDEPLLELTEVEEGLKGFHKGPLIDVSRVGWEEVKTVLRV